MKNIKVVYILLLLVFSLNAVSQSKAGSDIDPVKIKKSDYDWWNEARFGVFIHWGPSSILEIPNSSWRRMDSDRNSGKNKRLPQPPEEIVSGEYKKYLETHYRERQVPMEVYDNLFHVFNPVEFDAEELAQMIQDAGAGYVVFTTKHHDGFCMFDSKYTDYDIMSTPFGRDICKELSDACHKRGIKVLWYYSKADWFDPTYQVDNPQPYIDYLTNQVEELCTNYGDIAGLWWDGGSIEVPTRPLFEMIRKYQPTAISNGRIQTRGKQMVPGIKFSTPEQRVGKFDMKSQWESCVGMYPHDSWNWNGGYDCRSLEFCLHTLANCAAGDGNLLLDFGPTPLGEIPAEAKSNYLAMGDWLKKYGESIYGTRGGPYKPGIWGGSTRKGNNIYLHILQKWPGGILNLPALPQNIIKYEVLTGGDMKLKQTDDGVTITMNSKDINPINTLIKLTIEGESMKIKPIETLPEKSLAFGADVFASSSADNNHPAESVVSHLWEKKGQFVAAFGEEGASEGKAGIGKVPEHLKYLTTRELDNRRRYWEAAADDKKPWLMLDFGKEITFDRMHMRESAGTIRSFIIEYMKDEKWNEMYEGKGLEIFNLQLEKPVTTSKIRIRFTDFTEAPGIHVVHLY